LKKLDDVKARNWKKQESEHSPTPVEEKKDKDVEMAVDGPDYGPHVQQVSHSTTTNEIASSSSSHPSDIAIDVANPTVDAKVASVATELATTDDRAIPIEIDTGHHGEAPTDAANSVDIDNDTVTEDHVEEPSPLPTELAPSSPFTAVDSATPIEVEDAQVPKTIANISISIGTDDDRTTDHSEEAPAFYTESLPSPSSSHPVTPLTASALAAVPSSPQNSTVEFTPLSDSDTDSEITILDETIIDNAVEEVRRAAAKLGEEVIMLENVEAEAEQHAESAEVDGFLVL